MKAIPRAAILTRKAVITQLQSKCDVAMANVSRHLRMAVQRCCTTVETIMLSKGLRIPVLAKSHGVY